VAKEELMRENRGRIARSSLAGTALAVGALLITAGQWKRQTVRRLKRNSTVVMTRLGPIEYAMDGAGEPLLVFHATPGGYDQGLVLGRSLGPGFLVIAPSRPGYLRTPLSTGRSPEQQADAMAALLDALSIPKVAVLAASAGGPAAIAFALCHRERVSRLVLWQAIASHNRLDAQALTRGLTSTDTGAFVTSAALRVAPTRVFPAPVRSNATARRLLRALAHTIVPIDLRREGIENDAEYINQLGDLPLADIRVPTLIVHGDADVTVHYARALAAARQIPDARLLTIRGGTHESLFGDPQAASAIRRFLGGRVAPPALRDDTSRRSARSNRSAWSVLSWASALSVASAASLLSVGSFASLLSLASFASILSIGSSASVLSVGSSRSFLGIGTTTTRRS
jgi:2-hydroxy-6-oxonona-2,4-dienedioate hydrolase